MNKAKGFSFLELLICLTVAAILVALLVPVFTPVARARVIQSGALSKISFYRK